MAKKRFLQWWILLPLLPLLSACYDDGTTTPTVEAEGEYMVRLLIDPQATATRAPGDDVSAIRQLRVYVFNAQSTRVGYYENMSLDATGQAYYVPFRLSEGGLLDFYVVANEDGAGLTGLSNTTRSELEAMQYATASIDRKQGDLLTGKTTNVMVPAPDVPAGQVQMVECELSRPFSLLDVYFAKTSEGMDAQVTGITFEDYTTGGYIYEVRNVARSFGTEPLVLLAATDNPFDVKAIVSEDEHGTDAADYGDFAVSHPVSLNGRGTTTDWGNDWENEENTNPGQTYHPRLTVAYTVGGASKEAVVYLPPMRNPNTRYNVKCLIKENGGFGVECQVQDWIDAEHDYELSGTGQFTITNPNMRLFETGEDGVKYYATQYVEGADAQSRQLVFTLEMTSPEGVRWQAHLTNPQDFEFVGAAAGVGGAGAVTLQVRPTKVFDATGERTQTELYVTIGTNEGTAQSFDTDMTYTKDMQTLYIVQVSASEWENISSQQP